MTRFTVIACAALSFLLPVPGTSAAPPSSTIQDDFEARRAEVLRHRIEEARTKAMRGTLPQRPALRTTNQNQYDVLHYDLDLDLDPFTSTLTGTVTTTAEIVGDPISTMELHLQNGLTASAATVGGGATTFGWAAGILTVDLDRTYTTGETVVVGVSYSGNPAGSGTFAWDSYGGSDMIWTLSEPYGARDWWPCKDLNRDKAESVDLHVTVPDGLVVASNGTLVSEVDNGATRTFHWSCGHPIAPYLVSLAIHPYTTWSDSYTPQGGGTPMPLEFYSFPDRFASEQANYQQTASMIDAFAQAWGEYPFLDEKYGHADFTWGGGMEHQTCSSLGGWSIYLISHELAHQWFGDEITCRTFKHIWLNEGFATWAEAYWREATEGEESYHEYMDFAAYYGPGTIFVENPNDFNAIFDTNLSYNKASWVVHMLRGVVGDADFFAGLQQYRAQFGGDVAVTEDLRDVMESVSGIDLDAFFQQWIYGEYYPVYRYEWAPTADGVEVTVEQVQTNTGLFTMPIEVRVITDLGTTDFVVQNAAALETYPLTVAGNVEEVRLDPDRWILREVESTITSPTFADGILLVNGVDWETYGTEITSAYADSAFWGYHPITFWDTFSEPAGGYPSNLPVPAGHGAVPASTMGRYSAVVWVGNHYNGDLADWFESPIDSYLDVGGNLLLLSRRGQSFVDADLTAYLGITWTATQVGLGNCTAVASGLNDISFTGSQNWNDVFSTTVGPNSTLLFQDTSVSNRGTGVIAEPPGGGTFRPDGGKFAYVAGRPYRMNHAQLRSDVETILADWFGEPYTPTGIPGEVAAGPSFRLAAARPNPFLGRTDLEFSLRAAGRATLDVYDVSGRLVRRLVDRELPAGPHAVRWDGRDGGGRPVGTGVYFVRLRSGREAESRSVVLLR